MLDLNELPDAACEQQQQQQQPFLSRLAVHHEATSTLPASDIDVIPTPGIVEVRSDLQAATEEKSAAFDSPTTKRLARNLHDALKATVTEENETGFITQLLPVSLPSELRGIWQEARASSCDDGQDYVARNSSRFIPSSSRKDDRLPSDAREDDLKMQFDSPRPMFSLMTKSDNGIELLKDTGKSSEGSPMCLDLGSIFNSPSSNPLFRARKPDRYGLALGRTVEGVVSSKQITNATPFWQGKLRTEDRLLVRLVAYCLGGTRPDLRLEELPEILSSRKLVKMEEFQESLRHGVTEPFIHFKPSFDASLEEIQGFNSMVETLSGGTGSLQASYLVEVELGYQSLLVNSMLGSSAATLSWESKVDSSSDLKLYIVSPLSFQLVLDNSRLKSSICALKKIDLLDQESLYGFFHHSSANNFNSSLASFQIGKEDVEMRNLKLSTSRGFNSIPSLNPSGNRGKDVDATNGTVLLKASLSKKDKFVVIPDSLAKSAPMELKQVLSRVNANICTTDFGEDVRGSTVLPEGSETEHHSHRYSTKRKQETGTWNEHSKRSHFGGDLSEEDIENPDSNYQVQSKRIERVSCSPRKIKHALGQVQRQEWSRERLIDRESFWSRADGRDLGKKRDQRGSLNEVEKNRESRDRGKDLERENIWDRRHKLLETSSIEKVLDDPKVMFGMERSIGGPTSNLVFHHGADSNDENGMEKRTKKRPREHEKENQSCQEANIAALKDSVQAAKDESYALKIKTEVEALNHQEGVFPRELGPSEELAKCQSSNPCPKSPLRKESGGLSQQCNLEGTENNQNANSVHDGNFEITAGNEGGLKRTGTLTSEIQGVSDMKPESEALAVPAERTTGFPDGTPSKSNGSTDCPLATDEKEETSSEFLLNDFDRETRTWLTSKQNSLYLQEEYGVNATIKEEISDSHSRSKVEFQEGTLQVRISMPVSETCEAAEAKWFVDQAACMVKAIAAHGVFVKCLWYEGPVHLQPGDGAPSVPAVVKKIKGEDGKNIERMQEITGIMIGVVLRKGAVAAPRESNSIPRFIGLRLKCIRRKGLLEASKQAEALLVCVADHFSKEVAANLAEMQEAALHPTELASDVNSPSSHAVFTKDLPNSPLKVEGNLDDYGSLNYFDNSKAGDFMEDSDIKPFHKALAAEEEPKIQFLPELTKSSRPLYVSNLPDNVTPIKIRNIFESILKEKLGLPAGLERSPDLVVDVRYIPEKFCAFVELATDDILNRSLKLYAEDRSVFCGLKVKLGLAATSKLERQGTLPRSGRDYSTDNNPEMARLLLTVSERDKEEEDRRGWCRGSSAESESEYSHDLKPGENDDSRASHIVERPKPLFLTELMRNASAVSIKQLFEDVIMKYISPSLVSSSGRHLVLDVRYVPSRGCAFVDLATPELVEFMLDLHSRRPEVFLNMKMELGRKPVPHSIEDNTDRDSSMHNRDIMQAKSRSHRHISGAQLYGYRLSSSGSRKNSKRRLDVTYHEHDYIDYSDKADGLRRRRSDPEKTVYADRLPANASEGMIRRIFERVLFQNMTQEQLDVLGAHVINEVRYVPTKYCAFIVFAAEELTRLVLHLYNQDEDIFEQMRLKPHFHSRMEDFYREDLQEQDDDVRPGSVKDGFLDLDIHDYQKVQQSELYDARSRSSAHRAIAATAFKEVDRRRSVYVDRIPENLSEVAIREMLERVFRCKRLGYSCQIVSQVTFFRDKFDPKKLCAFVEVRNEEAAQDLINSYNANEESFLGMRVRSAFKYNN